MSVRSLVLRGLVALALVGLAPGRSEGQGIDLFTEMIGDFTHLPGGSAVIRGMALPMATQSHDPALAEILRDAALIASQPSAFAGDCAVLRDWKVVNGAQVLGFAPGQDAPAHDRHRRRQVSAEVAAAAAATENLPRPFSMEDVEARIAAEPGRASRAEIRNIMRRLDAHGLRASEAGERLRENGDPLRVRLRARGTFSRSACHLRFLEDLAHVYTLMGIQASVDNCSRLPEPEQRHYCAGRATDIEFVYLQFDRATALRTFLRDALGPGLEDVSEELRGGEVRAIERPADLVGLLVGLDRALVESGRVLPFGMFTRW